MSGRKYNHESEIEFFTEYDVSSTYQRTTSDEIGAAGNRLNQTTKLKLIQQGTDSAWTCQFMNTKKQCSAEQTTLGELLNIPHNE